MAADLERNLEQELAHRFESALAALDNEIGAMKSQHAAKGLLLSGATLGKVRELCNSLLDRLADDLANATEVLREAPEFNQLVAGRIVAMFGRVVLPDVPFAHARLEDAVNLVKQPRLLDRLHAEVVAHHGDVSRALRTRLERILLVAPPSPNRVLISIELVVLVFSAFLAGAWWRDPRGNYEPLLAIGGIVLAGLEFVRRVRKPG